MKIFIAIEVQKLMLHYDMPLTDINVISSVCVLNLRIKF